jgi:hypothetical protein
MLVGLGVAASAGGQRLVPTSLRAPKADGQEWRAMLSDGQKDVGACAAPVYNAPNPEMRVLSSRAPWVWCAFLLLSEFSSGASWQGPTAQLAQQISAITGPGVVAVELNNRSSLGAGDVDEIRRALTSSLENVGVRIWQPDQSAAKVRITLSENLSDYVWVAEVQSGASEPRLVFVSSLRPDSAFPVENTPPLTLHSTALISEDNPILDVAFLAQNPPRLLVLTTPHISIYEFREGHWTAVESVALRSPNPLPRDPHGRLIRNKDRQFDVYLPGLICHGSESGGLRISCSPSEDPWPLSGEDAGLSAFFSPARNFFTGALVPGIGKQRLAPAFYSAARVPKPNYPLWIFSGVDGQLHLMDGINQQTLAQIHWGSDIASLHAGCRSDWEVLATSAEHETEDSVQAFAFPDREPVAVSQKLTFRGNLHALWTSEAGDVAVASYRDSETGKYEAVQLNLTCGQ